MTSLPAPIEAAFAAARTKRASAVHVHGPRGAGKSRLIDDVVEAAIDLEWAVLPAQGFPEERDQPYGVLAAMLAHLGELVEIEWPTLRSVLRYEHRALDPFELKVSAFRFLCSVAAMRPTLIALDDARLVDAESMGVLQFVMRRADHDAICFVTADVDPAPLVPGAVLRVPPLDDTELTDLLIESGVCPSAAAQCAAAAMGNPGLALALADGLGPDQRSGATPVSVLPRPAGSLADDLQQRLRAHGDAVCRALVVAAAEHGGEVAAVRAALAALGESLEGLAAAEDAGLVGIVDTQLYFPDPWTRAAAYHLVAPASRRAAHRALAAWFDQPHQAAQRAWHLAAGADGPNDAVAEALVLLAADSARRGACGSAALTAERAAGFSETASHRAAVLLSALGWWLDAGDVDGVARVVRLVEPTDPESADAVAEARAFLDGDDRLEGPSSSGHWGTRRARRRTVAAAAEAGDHRALLRLIERRSLEQGSGADLLAAAVAHRHAGQVREARDHLVRAQAVLDPRSAPAVAGLLLHADLDLLQGRFDDAASALDEAAALLPRPWTDHRRRLAGRARLLADPALDARAVPDAFTAAGSGPLAAVRDALHDGVMSNDREGLAAALRLADEHSLPIEAAEARLWLAATAGGDDRAPVLDLAAATFHRCGVRGWDARLLALGTPSPAESALPRDPAIDGLSQAELRVADAVARGLTNREVASTLLISVKTVDFHLQQIYRKIGVRSRTELAVRMTGRTAATGERR